MRQNIFFLLIATCIITGFTACNSDEDGKKYNIGLTEAASGFVSPVQVTNAGDGSGRLFVVEQRGTIRFIVNKKASDSFYLDIRDKVVSGGEMGLLGLAFHPEFKTNKRFFVNYTAPSPLRTVISEFAAGETAEETKQSGRVILEVAQPYENHNGGQIEFGPEKPPYLYIGMGDGGSGGDPHGNGQNLKTLLGSMLRIDVDNKDSGLEYAIPADNPDWPDAGARREIFAYGLRNPWRFSFDSATGDLYAGDVGQVKREEIDIIKKGLNYGWNQAEGDICFIDGCDLSRFEPPIIAHNRSEMTVIIGGLVYRGKAFPALQGIYIYGDFNSGLLRGLRYQNGKVKADKDFDKQVECVSSFGKDEDDEVYASDYCNGIIYRISPP